MQDNADSAPQDVVPGDTAPGDTALGDLAARDLAARDLAGRDLARGDQALDVAQTVRAEIISGRIAPGARLGQDDLAKRFRVSRMPVREALRLLQAEGLVELSPNRSAVAASIDADDMIDIFDMRIALETLAIRQAIPNLSNAQIDAAGALQRVMEAAAQRDYGDLNAQLHLTLYAPSGRPRLLAEIQRLAGHADRYLRLALNAPDQRRDSDNEHRALVEACYARAADRAVDIVERHIAQARDRLGGLMRPGVGDGGDASPHGRGSTAGRKTSHAPAPQTPTKYD